MAGIVGSYVKVAHNFIQIFYVVLEIFCDTLDCAVDVIRCQRFETDIVEGDVPTVVFN